MSRILITGGAGFVGSVLVNWALQEDYEVVVLDNLDKGGDSLLCFNNHPKFKFIKGNILDTKTLYKIKEEEQQLDGIIHLAAIVGLGACNANPMLSELVNHQGSLNICNAFSHLPIVYASTGSIYGKIEGTCTEESIPNPLSVYGSSKYNGEKAMTDYGKVSLRFATAIGVSPQMRLNLLPNELVYEAITNKNISVFEPDNMRTFIAVQDMARAFIFMLKNYDQLKHKVYNVGSEKNNWSKRQLAEYIQQKTNCALTFHNNLKDLDARDYQVSYQRLADEDFTLNCGLDMVIDQLIKSIPLLKKESKYV